MDTCAVDVVEVLDKVVLVDDVVFVDDVVILIELEEVPHDPDAGLQPVPQ